MLNAVGEIIVNVPHLDGSAPLGFAAVFAGVAQFFGEDTVVAFDFPVVFRCVWPDAVVPRFRSEG